MLVALAVQHLPVFALQPQQHQWEASSSSSSSSSSSKALLEAQWQHNLPRFR
jgi:hypothetical protein